MTRTASRLFVVVYKSLPRFLFVFVLSALMLAMIACAALSAGPALVTTFVGAPTAARSLSWSQVVIAKPTYTPSALPVPSTVPTDTPSTNPTPTDIAPPLVMNIVEDSAAPALASQSDPDSQMPSQTYSGGKYILVSISEQHLYAYENGQLIYSFIASTGMGNSTRAGIFSVLDKIPNAYGATWNIWMPNWLGIYWSGSLENGIHALPILPGGDRLWSGYLGTPISFGCVVLGVNEASELYNWADIGTPVEIRW